MGRLLAGLTAGRGKVGLLGIGRNMYQWQSTVQEHQETTPFFPASVLRGNLATFSAVGRNLLFYFQITFHEQI